jgi:hypothetical protein
MKKKPTLFQILMIINILLDISMTRRDIIQNQTFGTIAFDILIIVLFSISLVLDIIGNNIRSKKIENN